MSRPHVVTPSELSALRDLELATRVTVEGVRQGLHRSPFHGYSAEFSQFRHYHPGDDLKYVDWKAYARTDRLFTRQFRETTNLRALFVVDVSKSMDFPAGGGASKLALARSVTAVLGTLVLDQGDAAGVLAIGDAVQYLPPRSGHHHLKAFLSQVASLAPAGTAGVHAALARASTLLKQRGLVVVVSDFYEEAAALTGIRRLARRGHDVIVVHVLSAEEMRFDIDDASRLVDLETGQALVVHPDAARAGYREAMAAWLTNVERQVTADGLDYLRVVTGEPLDAVLRRFLVSRRGGR